MTTNYLRQSIYAPDHSKGGYLSVEQIRKHSLDLGHHYFSPMTMKFFGSKVYNDLVLGRFFITSEHNFNRTARLYTIREVRGNECDINTVGEFQQYATLRAARAALKKIGEA